jgi:hypothetical protein
MRRWVVGLAGLVLAGCVSVEPGDMGGACTASLNETVDDEAAPDARIAELTRVLATCGDEDLAGRGAVLARRGQAYADADNWSSYQEGFSQAADVFERAILRGDFVSSRAMAMLYLRAERLEDGLHWAEHAHREAGETPTMPEYRLMMFYYSQLEDWEGQRRISEAMTQQWPEEKRNWQSYAAALAMTGREREAFDVNVLMYERGMLTESSEIVRVAQRYTYYEEPVPGAELLDRELEAGRVDRTSANYRSLALMWRQAGRPDRAIRPASIAARATDSLENWLLLARLHQDVGDNSAARRALIDGLDRAGNDWRHEAWLLLAELNAVDHNQLAELRARQAALYFEPMPDPYIPPLHSLHPRFDTDACRAAIRDLVAVAGAEGRVDETGLVVIIPMTGCASFYDHHGVSLDGGVDLSASLPMDVLETHDANGEMGRIEFMQCRDARRNPGCAEHYDEQGHPNSDVAHRFAEQDRLGW